MPYAKLLRKLISNTNYTNAEIIRKCEEYGEHIDETYFSKFLNGNIAPPNEKKSRAIARALGIDERMLVIEGYIDKAPKEIKEALHKLKVFASLSALKYIGLLEKNKLHELKKYFENEPLADMVIDILDNSNNYIEYLEQEFHTENIGNGKEIRISLNNPVGIEIHDNAMAPEIEKGDKVLFELIGENYNNVDILLVKTKKNPEIRVRNVIKINNTRQLQGHKPEYIEEPCDKNDVIILGRVNKVIKTI